MIASDKTGTLTQNVMTVENLWFNLTPYAADVVLGKREGFLKYKSFKKLFKVASLCNRSFIERDEKLKKLDE